jgi:hypothetical protein
MKIKNGEIEAFANFLMDFELKGRESRLRTRFVKFLMERVQLITEEHRDLIRQFARFDEEGNPIIIEENGIKMYDVPDRAGFNREYYLLLNEDFIIEENEERKEMLLFIKELILNCDKTFKGKKAMEYDRWCEIVEEINYDE